MWFCSECGKKNNGKFCTYCGTKHEEFDEAFVSKARFGVSLASEEPDNIFIPSEQKEEPVFSAASLFRKHCSDEDIVSVPVKEEPVVEEEMIVEESATEEIFEVEEVPVVEEETVSETDEDDFAPLTDGEDFGVEQLGFLHIPEQIPNFTESIDTEIEPLTEAAQEEEISEESEPYIHQMPVSPYSVEEEKRYPQGWTVPFLRNDGALTEKENGSALFMRKDAPVSLEEVAENENPDEEKQGIAAIFTHRFAPESEDEKVLRWGQKAIIAVGAVVGVVMLAVIVLVASLFVNFSRDKEELPTSTGIYYYVSGVEETTALYEDKRINSEVLAELENGDAVEFLDEVNARFVYVYHEESEQYGYIRSDDLVSDFAAVDFCNVENKYADEKSLGYWYVTKTENGLNLWENPDGGGVVKAKLKNGFKVSVLEKTNDTYWYVFDYNSAERGYVRTAYLTDDKSKVVGIVKEPKDKTVIGDLFVTGVQNYLPIYAEPSTSAKVRGKLNNGDKVGLIQKTNSKFWYISANGVYGWVSAAYLTATDPNAAPAPEPTPPPADTSMDYKVYNTQEYLPVLKDPVSGAEELGRIHNGDTVTLIKEYDDKFWYVKIPSLGIEGYVSKNYLTK